ncbi:MAG: hypothetical protein JG764_1673 [Clostridiales bacterium]|jgi:gas vesicle protein|nr:hypothetical protein [Clostridiales bacterium]
MRSFLNGLLTGGIIGVIIALLFFTPDVAFNSDVKLGKVRKLHKKTKRMTKDVF